jgi:sodium-dependent dicarboxylate transporter 2/3/5
LRDSATLEVRAVQATCFSRLKRTAAFAARPAVAALVLFAPSPELPRDAQVLAAILTWVVLYWVVEPIPLPVTGVFGTVLCVLVVLGSFRTVFAPYAHPIMFLLIGSLLLAEAMTVHGVAERFAAALLLAPWAAGPMRLLLMIGIATAGVSMWISNTAATALMWPIALSIATCNRCRFTSRSGP